MKLLGNLFAFVTICLTSVYPATAMDSLDTIDGYYKLSESSKRVVKAFIEKEEECFRDKLDGENYPVMDWFVASPKATRAEIMHHHGLYNMYICSNAEREHMIDKLRTANEDDLYVLNFLHNQKFISEPLLPPWFTNEQREKVQQLIKKYPKPFEHGRVFSRIRENTLR